MEARNNASTDWEEIGRLDPGANESQSPFLLTFVTLRNVHTGQIRVDVQVPYAKTLRFPEDLGVLLRCFGWGMASLGTEWRNCSFETWHGCCEVLWQVDSVLKIVD